MQQETNLLTECNTCESYLTLSMLVSSFFLTPLERSTLFTCFLLSLLLSSLELPSLFALLLFPVVLVLPVLLTCFVLSPLSSCLTLFTLLGLSSFFESLSGPAFFISILLLSLLSCLLMTTGVSENSQVQAGHSTEKEDNAAERPVRRSTRTIRQPARYKDFVLDV